MTAEQIEALHRKIRFGLKLAEDEPMGSTGSEHSIRRGIMRETPLAFQRLLEERERLYEALDALLAAKNPDSLEMAREALAFAEGPA